MVDVVDAVDAVFSQTPTSMAVGIGKYMRSKTRGRLCGKYAVNATAAVDAVQEDLHMRSTRYFRDRRGV